MRVKWIGISLVGLLAACTSAPHGGAIGDGSANAVADAEVDAVTDMTNDAGVDAAADAESADVPAAQTADVAPVEPAHPHVWPAAPTTYTKIRPLLTQYCASCHAASVIGAARNGAPEHETLDDPDALKTEIAHLRDYTTLPPGPTGKVMPPVGWPQPSVGERALLVQWLNDGAKTQADHCFRDFTVGNTRIVTAPTAGGRPDVHTNHNGIYTPQSPDVVQKGDLIQGRFPVPAGSTFHLHATRPPLGYARQPVTMQWFRDCQPIDPPPGAVLGPDGTLSWTPGWDDIDDHVVQLNAAGGDEGREIVIAARPDTPSTGCHVDSGALEVSATVPSQTGVASTPLVITVHNLGGQAVALTDIVVRGIAAGGTPDPIYPPQFQGKILQPGETAQFSSLMCAFPSLDLPNRPARYVVTASGTVVGSNEPICGGFISSTTTIAGAVAAPPGRELPELEEVARLMGLLEQDATTKSLMVSDYNKDGLIDFAFSQMGHAPRVLLATGDQLHFSLASTLEYDGTLGIAAGQVDRLGNGTQDLLLVNWPDLQDITKYLASVRLYRNDGVGNFTLDTQTMATTEHIAGRNANVLDFDNDGFEDVYVTTCGGVFDANENHPPGYQVPTNLLYHNDGQGGFAEIGVAANARGSLTASGLAVIDANEDGWPDLWMNGYGQPMLLINQADGTFAEQKLDFSGWKYHYLDPKQPDKLRFGTWMNGFGDFNADGHIDIVVGSMLYRNAEVPNHVWIGDGKGGFKLDSETCNLGHADPCLSWSMGLQVGDFNDDGYPEVYMGGGEPSMGWHHQLWLNATLKPGDMPHFLDRTAYLDYPASGATARYPYRGHGGTLLDLDGDLDLDFVQGNGGMDPDGSDPGAMEAWRVFLNRGTKNGKLELDLRGFPSNLNAVGARVDVVLAGGTGPQHLRQWMFPNNGFGGANLAGRLHFGLYDAKQIASLQVLWPDGQVTVHQPQLNTRLPLNEKDFIRFGTDFRKDNGGFTGGGQWLGRALCFDQGETATHAIVGAGSESSLAARVDFGSGADAGQSATLAMNGNGGSVSLHFAQGSVTLQTSGGKSLSAPLQIQVNRRFLARVAVEKNAAGTTDAVAYVNTREVARLPGISGFVPQEIALSGKKTCWAMVSLR